MVSIFGRQTPVELAFHRQKRRKSIEWRKIDG
jgi:transcription antitermination factor NusG